MKSNILNVQNAGTDGRNEYLDILEAAWQEHLKPKESDAPTVISLFAGCGGSSLGYSMAGYQELLAVEWDDNAVATFKLNFPDVPVYHDDIHNLSVDECLELTGLQPGELDVLDGSPPCQGFSTAGKRQMDDQRNQLYMEYIRLLRGLKPKVLIMENVSGLVKGKMKLIFADIMRELKASGYDVKCRLMNAMYFNVPQSRQRLIWIGVRKDLGIEPKHPKGQKTPISVKNALLDCEPSEMPSLQNNAYTRLYEKIPVGGSLADVRTDGNGYNNMVKLNPNRPSPAIPKTVTNRGAMTIVHWQEKRLMSHAEIKRLHSVPDFFKLSPERYDNQWACIGNSVPPLFMRSIANHIKQEILADAGTT